MNDKQSKRETFAGLTEENERLHSDLQKAKTDNDQLRRDLGLLKKQLSRKISLDDDRLQQMEMEELWEKLTRLEEEKLSLTKTISELATSKETLSKEVEELLAKNQSLEKKLTSSKGQLAHCEEELNESKDLNVFLQDQIDEIKMQLKKEICEAHDELRALYEEFRSSHASSDSVEIDDLEPSSDFKPGCLTTFVKNFRDVLEEMVRDNSTRTTNLRQQLCKAHENLDSLEAWASRGR